jgi:hypothetical protein
MFSSLKFGKSDTVVSFNQLLMRSNSNTKQDRDPYAPINTQFKDLSSSLNGLTVRDKIAVSMLSNLKQSGNLLPSFVVGTKRDS